MTIAQEITNYRKTLEAEKNRKSENERIRLTAESLAAITKAISPKIRQEIISAAWEGKKLFVICTTNDVPSKDGRSLYSLCPVGRAGNMYCAVNDGVVSHGQIYTAYPVFGVIRDHYENEGLKVVLQPNYSDGGESDWVELVVIL